MDGKFCAKHWNCDARIDQNKNRKFTERDKAFLQQYRRSVRWLYARAATCAGSKRLRHLFYALFGDIFAMRLN